MKEVTSEEELEYLYDNWAMTWEGLLLDEKTENQIIEMCGGENAEVFKLTGKKMNEICELSGNNAYPDDLTIVSVYPFKGLAIQFGARWMYDIIDNNARREGYHPFDYIDNSDYDED